MKFKTMMCKHYNTTQGCSYGDKCQFAHGPQELRLLNNQSNINSINNINSEGKKSKINPINIKTVKCKNWEKNGTCKYGNYCTFAHGENDLKKKEDNLFQMQMNMSSMYFNPMLMDINLMQMQNQLIMAGQLNPSINMKNNMQNNQNPQEENINKN